MNKKDLLLGLTGLLLCCSVHGASSPVTPSEDGQQMKTISVIRGQPIKLSDLSAIADMSSARDQKGNPAEVDEDVYTIGSFTRTTITIVPQDGKPEDVITLDLLKKE